MRSWMRAQARPAPQVDVPKLSSGPPSQLQQRGPPTGHQAYVTGDGGLRDVGASNASPALHGQTPFSGQVATAQTSPAAMSHRSGEIILMLPGPTNPHPTRQPFSGHHQTQQVPVVSRAAVPTHVAPPATQPFRPQMDQLDELPGLVLGIPARQQGPLAGSANKNKCR